MKKASIIILCFLSIVEIMAQPQKKSPQNPSKHPGFTISQSTTVKDIDGNIYNTVVIGKQTWMVENLKTTKFKDGGNILVVTDPAAWNTFTTPTPCFCWYDNDIENKELYGGLYNWHAVNTGKLAPKGWHVPTDAEWSILETYLMENGYNYDGSTSGNKYANALASDDYWEFYGEFEGENEPGTVGGSDFPNSQNKSGFNAYPNGCLADDFFGNKYYHGYWWSATESSIDNAWYRLIAFDISAVARDNFSKNLGFSVRCIKD